MQKEPPEPAASGSLRRTYCRVCLMAAFFVFAQEMEVGVPDEIVSAAWLRTCCHVCSIASSLLEEVTCHAHLHTAGSDHASSHTPSSVRAPPPLVADPCLSCPYGAQDHPALQVENLVGCRVESFVAVKGALLVTQIPDAQDLSVGEVEQAPRGHCYSVA